MEVERTELQLCPKCGCSAEIHNRNHKYWYECNGCWTQGDKCSTVEKARESWNSLEPRPKKTNLEILQEIGAAGMAKFLTDWAQNHEKWRNYTEEDVADWLNEEVDPELEAIAGL